MDATAHWVDAVCPLERRGMETYTLFMDLYIISPNLLQNVGLVRTIGSDANG